ncbi:ArsR/SmtB family transcription factor [Fervidibacillus albus]|uniref:Helix-turn-helix domain-containing protein n=1 Tax=Fervidibacillus albus TaxID=2980026 RepID=A0A9E8RVN6_9BACI|nr:helix-turn-helix domain-containing protein [Fervidibacillus albus]WAA10860.1 helix-turn-helix domain-containing protein [Fervidibacillus albus]
MSVLEALSNPYRLKILSILHQERQYVSQLARVLEISRPLLYLHLKKLEEADLIRGQLELSESGKAVKYYELIPFSMTLNPDEILKFSGSLTLKNKKEQ